MKINEINQSTRIDEGLGSTLFGEVPAAAIKGMFSGTSTQHQLAKSIFLKDFYSDASMSLKNGIESGLVDPSLEGDLTGTQQDPPADAPPAAASPAPNTPPPTPPAGAPQLPAPAATKSLPSPGPAAPGLPAPSGSTPPQLPGPAGAAKALPAPDSSPGKTKSWKPRPGKVYYSQGPSQIPQRASATNVTYSKPTQKPASQQIIQGKSKLVPLKPKTTENKFSKLNAIFESILEAGEEATAESVSEFMLDWFSRYMAGVNWEARKSKILPLIKNIEATYAADKGKSAIQKLGQLAYAISDKQIPAGAKNAMPPTSSTGTPPASSAKTSPEELLAGMANLKQTKPAEYKQVQRKLDELPK